MELKENRPAVKYQPKGRKTVELLEESNRNFMEELLELEMAIEDEEIYLNGSKMEDISNLIQLYMRAIEALEAFNDHRYRYFSKKLNSLMLKKTVFQQLNRANEVGRVRSQYMTQAQTKEEKRQQHHIQLIYSTDLKEREFLQAEKRLDKSKEIARTGLKKQEETIKERIRQRKLRSENGSVKDIKENRNYGYENRMQEYFGQDYKEPIVNIAKKPNFVTSSRNHGVSIGKPPKCVHKTANEMR